MKIIDQKLDEHMSRIREEKSTRNIDDEEIIDDKFELKLSYDEWQKKYDEGMELKMISLKIIELQEVLLRGTTLDKLQLVDDEIKLLINKFDSIKLKSTELLKSEAMIAIDDLQRTVEQKFARAERRIKELSLVDESDLQVAAAILKVFLFIIYHFIILISVRKQFRST